MQSIYTPQSTHIEAIAVVMLMKAIHGDLNDSDNILDLKETRASQQRNDVGVFHAHNVMPRPIIWALMRIIELHNKRRKLPTDTIETQAWW